MKIPQLLKIIVMALAVAVSGGDINAEEIRVAVASNFSEAIKELVGRFKKNSGHKVVVIYGSTGKHYAQIKHGAPYDAFFAADAVRPALLEEQGIAIPSSRFTYAIGKVALWSPREGYVDAKLDVLHQRSFRYLALANPKLAPYGQAAKEVLQSNGLWKALQSKLVRGENIGQAYQFVKSGNAELGFVAYSQVKTEVEGMKGSIWLVPQALYTPIEQQAVLLKESAAAHDFIRYVKSDESQHVIRSFGYGSL